MTRLTICVAVSLSLLAGCAGPVPSGGRYAPTLSRTIALKGVGAPRADVGVPGRIDHLAYDPATQRLFVAALEHGSVEVLDLERGERVRSIGGLGHPQGIAVARSAGAAVVACGNGDVRVFDTRTLEERHCRALGRGADNVRYDSQNDVIYVTYASTEGGAIVALNPHTWEKLREISFVHRPESFQLDLNGTRVFANVPGGVRATQDGFVAVADRETGHMLAEIPLPGRARNFPMAFDSGHERLFIACRLPARLMVIDTKTNQVAGEIECAEDSDDLFYDGRTNRVLVIGGGFRPDMQDAGAAARPAGRADEIGAIDVFAVGDDGRLSKLASTPTAPHARTGLFVPQRRALYVAVPPYAGRDPEIREYRVAD